MRNFTLGKNRIPLFFFALFLMIGTSSYGQCPTLTNQTPGDFCYLSTVADLTDVTEASVTEGEVAWYRTATSANPIPENELLQDGSYFAGNANGTCNDRIEVTVVVVDAGPPTSTFGITFQPCEYNEDDTSTVADLLALIEGNNVQIFEDEFSETALDSTAVLVDGENYFAGQRSSTECSTSSRLALRYDPILTLAPDAVPVQTFCEGATVADLQAQATSDYTQNFRWYSTETSNPPLDPSTPLIDGETYYASQIINRSNSPLPPCESVDRAEVTVDLLTGDAGSPNIGVVCESEVQETFPSIDAINNYFLALLDEGVSRNGTFNPTAEQLAQQYQNDADGLGDFSTTYTLGEEECEASVLLTVSIVAEEEANAGTIEDIFVECGNEDIIVLDDSILSDDATTGGTFSGEGLNEDGNFDPAIGPGTYTITYSVDDSADCVIEGSSDSTTFDITVQGSELGEPIVMELCITEAQALLTSPADAEAFFNNILEENGITNFDGSFDPSEDVVGSEIYAYINSNPTAPETFETTYSISTDCGDDSVLVSLTINDTTAPDAGDITPAPVCASTIPFNLNSLLGGNNDQGGTFSENGELIEGGLFDVSQTGQYTITYTVTESAENCTEGEPDSSTFTLKVNEGIVAESPENAIVCETDVQETFPSIDEIRKYFVAIAQEAGFPTNGTLDPSPQELAEQYQADEDGLGEFTSTYTFGEGDCQTSVDLTVEIVPATDANAGSIEDVTVDCDNEESIVLATLTNEGGNTGGTFSGEGVTNGSFDPSVGPGTYTITYSVDDTADCVTPGTSDETTFTITVQDSFDLGEPIVMEMCITEVQAMLTDPQLAIDLFNDTIAERTDGDLSGEFTPSIETLAGQIATYLSNPTPSQTFETIYSVSTECGDDSVLISLTINDVTEANTGDIADFQVCAADSPINLYDRLTNENTQGGTFSIEDEEIENGLFDVSQMGEYTITYTVSEEDEGSCVEGTASTQFTVTVTDEISLENPAPAIVCESDVDTTFPSVDEIRKFYVALIPAGIPTNGTFNPTAAQIAQIYQNDEDGLGDFTTTYTVTTGDCVTTVDLTARIVAEEEATVEPIENEEVCISEDGLDLSIYLTGNTTGGTFTSENGVITNGMLDVSMEGTFNITYTVDESDEATCLTGTASTEFTVTVGENMANAGADNSRTICNSQAKNLSAGGVRNLFLGLLEEGVDRNGVFNPTIQEIIDQYNTEGEIGDFTTTYTVGTGDCQDSTVLTVTVLESLDAGQDVTVTLEEDATETVDLFEALGGTPDEGGVWTYDGNEVDAEFDPATDAEGRYTYTVTSENGCTDSAVVTVVVGEPVPCPEIAEPEQTFCGDATVADLAPADVLWYDSADATTPLAAETALTDGGVYFAGDAEGLCEGRESVTVTIAETPAAPTVVTPFEDCVVTGATVADLEITPADGNEIMVFTDEAMETPVEETDLLVEGVYYVVQINTAGCASEPAMITVTLTDSEAPTLVSGGNVFCEFDQATLADLEANISGDGEIIWYATEDGTEPLSTNEVLENEVTYYAAMTDVDSACESSERLAVTVTLEACEIIIPEAFSPNGDGINDRFIIPNLDTEFPDFRLEIYNRWGEEVYIGNAGTPGWDGYSTEGSFGDGRLPSGVYFYILYFNDGETAPVQGRVYLSI